MSVSFSGLAAAGSFSTHSWLLNALCDCASPDFSIVGIVTRLKDRLTTEFADNRLLRNLRPDERRLSLLFAGFKAAGKCPIYGILSNWQNPMRHTLGTGASDHFSFFPGKFAANLECVTVGIGMIESLSAERITQLRRHAPGLPPRTLALRLYHAVREAAGRASSFNMIGIQATSLVIPADPLKTVTSSYHVGRTQKASYMPAMVWAMPNQTAAVAKVQVDPPNEAAPLSVPVVSRNQPCPCGKPVKYKHCHGRR